MPYSGTEKKGERTILYIIFLALISTQMKFLKIFFGCVLCTVILFSAIA